MLRTALPDDWTKLIHTCKSRKQKLIQWKIYSIQLQLLREHMHVTWNNSHRNLQFILQTLNFIKCLVSVKCQIILFSENDHALIVTTKMAVRELKFLLTGNGHQWYQKSYVTFSKFSRRKKFLQRRLHSEIFWKNISNYLWKLNAPFADILSTPHSQLLSKQTGRKWTRKRSWTPLLISLLRYSADSLQWNMDVFTWVG